MQRIYAWSVSELVKHLRKIVQVLWGFISNGYIKGFLPGGPLLYSGPLKRFCVPGINCHSCPGALMSCPVGAVQSLLSGRDRRFPFYVVGYLSAIGLFLGRFICGWLCLFGLIQELLYKIPTPKVHIPKKIDMPLRYLKYTVLVILVIFLPLFYRGEYGIGETFFCKYLCPAGTLEGGVPLVVFNDAMHASIGWLFRWKVLILILFILSSIFIYRPFCKYICPLGAFYSLFQRISLLRMSVDKSTCINCGSCSNVCGMDVDPHITPDNAECIRCGECMKVCPTRSLKFTRTGKTEKRINKQGSSTCGED